MAAIEAAESLEARPETLDETVARLAALSRSNTSRSAKPKPTLGEGPNRGTG